MGRLIQRGERTYKPVEEPMKNTETETLFDVVIYRREDRKIDTIIGLNMRRWDGTGSGRNTADMRKQIGEDRINGNYAVEIVHAGKFKVGDVLPLSAICV